MNFFCLYETYCMSEFLKTRSWPYASAFIITCLVSVKQAFKMPFLQTYFLSFHSIEIWQWYIWILSSIATLRNQKENQLFIYVLLSSHKCIPLHKQKIYQHSSPNIPVKYRVHISCIHQCLRKSHKQFSKLSNQFKMSLLESSKE
jgi:predicted neutral ceramidase superfamily lipid hydrolase